MVSLEAEEGGEGGEVQGLDGGEVQGLEGGEVQGGGERIARCFLGGIDCYLAEFIISSLREIDCKTAVVPASLYVLNSLKVTCCLLVFFLNPRPCPYPTQRSTHPLYAMK